MKPIFEYIMSKNNARNFTSKRNIPQSETLLDYNAKHKFSVHCKELYKAIVNKLYGDDDWKQKIENEWGFNSNDIDPSSTTKQGCILISLSSTIYGHEVDKNYKKAIIANGDVIKELFEDFWNDDIKVDSHKDSYSMSYTYTLIFPTGEAIDVYVEGKIKEIDKFRS